MGHLVPPQFLFQWSFPIRKCEKLPYQSGRLLRLSDRYQMPSIDEIGSTPHFADLRLAWNEDGLAMSVAVSGRTRSLKCTVESPATSDGLHVWFNTRNSQVVHRATKYCQQFSFLPKGAGHLGAEPIACVVPMARAREEFVLADPSLIEIQSETNADGYWMDVWMPANVFVGFDPAQHPRLGFHYVIRDSQLGEQYLAVGNEFPHSSDPSLWQTLELSPE